MKRMVLLGGGGHCKSVLDTLSKFPEFEIVGILDIESKVGDSILQTKIIGVDDDLFDLYLNGIDYAFITAGSIGNTDLRIRLYKKIKEVGIKTPNIIDDTAIISDNIVLGEGNFIGKGAIINSGVILGNNCIINTGAIIEHDCRIGDFCHVAPGSTLSGGVELGNNTHIGTNSTIIQNIKIGKNTLIGAGSVVIHNISDNAKAYGNPCKEV